MLMQYNSILQPVVGVYCWDLSTNRLIADDVYADLYGFSPQEVVEGLTIEDVIARICPDDREDVAKQVHHAITSGSFSTITFRVKKGGTIRHVVAHGRCLRDKDGVPHIYTGTVQFIATPSLGSVMRPLGDH